MMTDQLRGDILRHYAGAPLTERIIAALQASGKSLASLQIDDLAPLDEFHTRGRRTALKRQLTGSVRSLRKTANPPNRLDSICFWGTNSRQC